VVPETYDTLRRVIDEQLAVFPDHRSYLEKRFAKDDEPTLRFADDVAKMVEQVCGGDLKTICADYHWLSGIVLEEEIYFRRTGRYRCASFEEAVEQVYSNREYMTRYMNGLLTSQLWWRNHTEVLRYFRDVFIGGAPDGFTHLEVGPGHGLFLALAASSPKCRVAEGWDISDASLANTRDALNAMQIAPERVILRKIDIFASPDASFDSITFSEVLEHLQEPVKALKALYRLLAPGGRIFVNAPINSPAPDHLYLFNTPEEVPAMLEEAGFVVHDTFFSPCTGATLDRARRLKLTVSAAVIAGK
jgi:ubiquinone/menaquinone biosynthesis C-methylase UbiE